MHEAIRISSNVHLHVYFVPVFEKGNPIKISRWIWSGISCLQAWPMLFSVHPGMATWASHKHAMQCVNNRRGDLTSHGVAASAICMCILAYALETKSSAHDMHSQSQSLVWVQQQDYISCAFVLVSHWIRCGADADAGGGPWLQDRCAHRLCSSS
jgi:hypothetical protein